jgi:hypothetical protein
MKKLISAVLIAGSLFADNFANIQITDKTVMVEGQGQVSYSQPVYVRGGYLINSGKEDFFYGGIKSEGQVIGVDMPVKFSLMLDFVHTTDNSALPIGIGASSYIGDISLPVFIRGEFEYAPAVLSFEDADKFMKYKIETGVRFIENGEVFVGYRNISFDDYTYNSNVYAGVGFIF